VTWTHAAFESVAELLRERTGLRFAPDRSDAAEVGMRRAMARAKISDPDEYRQLLQADAAALDDLVAELAVGETYFFREPQQFAFIRTTVLADVRRRRGPEPHFRTWSAGCASGEEAYSLAIVLEEEGFGDRAHVHATDMSRAALARARRAVYGAWSLRGEGAETARRHLRPDGSRFVLDESIRRRVSFEYLNLALDVYPSFATGTWGMDLILCRNVLIYFDPAAVAGVARRLFASLAPGGWLLTASSDPPLSGHAPYETVVTDAGVFYRRAEAVAFAPPAVAPAPPPVPPPAPPKATRRTVPTGPPRPEPVTPAPDPRAEAREALARGEYARAAALTGYLTADPEACALHVRALANLDPDAARQACADAAARHPLAAELHYLEAVLLVDAGRDEEAARAARRVLYVDRTLAAAHFTLGSILRRLGRPAGARRAYRNARDLCAARPADEVVPLSDGEHAGRLAEAAAAQLVVLEAAAEVSP
jgi:chemotaxis protein methyltransferase CheR